VDEIHGILKKAGVAPANIAYSIRPVAKLPLSQMTASFSFAADYRRFKQLLELFESGQRWIVVKEISIARNSDVPGAVEAHMTVATYFVEGRPSRRSRRPDGACRRLRPGGSRDPQQDGIAAPGDPARGPGGGSRALRRPVELVGFSQRRHVTVRPVTPGATPTDIGPSRLRPGPARGRRRRTSRRKT
jgi:hypothetical protein